LSKLSSFSYIFVADSAGLLLLLSLYCIDLFYSMYWSSVFAINLLACLLTYFLLRLIFNVVGSQNYKIGWSDANNGRCAVQGNSRSLNSISVENPYATSS